MMKKRNIFSILLFCMMAMVASFASCSDDDEKESKVNVENTPFVGTWSESGIQDYDTYTFKSDGTFSYVQTLSGPGEFWYGGAYQYDAVAKMLRLTVTYCNDDYYELPWTETYVVRFISDNSITLVDVEKPTATTTLKRVE